jgi:hypothetical protein
VELLCGRGGEVLVDSGDLFVCEFKLDDDCSVEVRLLFCSDAQEDANRKNIQNKTHANVFLDLTTTSKASVQFILPLHSGRRLTLGLTGRAHNVGAIKLTMKDMLTRAPVE